MRGETYLEPALLALGPAVDTGVCHCVSVGLGGHEAGEAKPELADVRAHLTDREDTGGSVTGCALKYQVTSHLQGPRYLCATLK